MWVTPVENQIEKSFNFVTFVRMSGNKYKYFLLKIPIALALLFIALGFMPIHRYFFSLTELRADTKKQTLNVSCKLFTDDLETALSSVSHKKTDLSASLQNKEVKDLLNKYINDHFKISITGKPLKLTFVGFENEDDATWCYLELAKFTQKGKVTIMDDFLDDLFPDQTNIIQFYWNQENKSMKLVNPEKEAVFEF
jgi:RNA recognition motif-containing protein